MESHPKTEVMKGLEHFCDRAVNASVVLEVAFLDPVGIGVELLDGYGRIIEGADLGHKGNVFLMGEGVWFEKGSR